MNDTTLAQHYQQILGDTKPWFVSQVELDATQMTIVVRLSLPPDALWGCPACQGRMHIKEWRPRRWRHMDACQFKLYLEASVPKVECQEHGSQTVQVPWAEGKSRFTQLFECFAIEVLQSCNADKAGKLLGISWDEADGIKQRAVRRGLARRSLKGLEYVCVDEKAVGHGHDYLTIVTGIISGKPQVLYLGEGKGEEGLNGFWNLLGPEGCRRIKAVSMDMGKAYQASARRYCPQAELIFDPFHIMKMINKAVDSVRRLEIIIGTKEERNTLKGTRPLWLWGEENLPACHAARFDSLKQSALRTARAWRLKELWRTFKHCINVADAMTFFQRWYASAIHSKLEPIKTVARTLKEHLAGIVSIFNHGFCNAMAEGVNSRIQLLVQKSCGYRNRERLKTDILFHFGGLDLNPLPTQ
jgi:transposase